MPQAFAMMAHRSPFALQLGPESTSRWATAVEAWPLPPNKRKSYMRLQESVQTYRAASYCSPTSPEASL